jgi:phosphoribosylamine---glycine ligase
MRILVIGSGAREHAIIWALAREGSLDLACTPGNPGIAELARCHAVEVTDIDSLLALAAHERADLTVVGPELPLSLGLVDDFKRSGLKVFGPTKAAAALEWSKAFAKDFMQRHRVPTARFEVCSSASQAKHVLASGTLGFPVVVKADGLAAGKGVVIAPDLASATQTIDEMMVDRRFGASGETVVLEEFLTGEEVSYFVLACGEHCVPLSSAQDHKRIFDGDQGPNTGGMGAFSPSPLMTPQVEARVLEEIVRPVLRGMVQEGRSYEGFLYVGLMLTPTGPKVVEFNARFGDPEAQVILPRLKAPLSTLLNAAASGELSVTAVPFSDDKYVGVVLASGGYPERSGSGAVISGVQEASGVDRSVVFHAGTARREGALVTHGGRVLTVVGHGPSYEAAIEAAYRAVTHIHFDGMQVRRDIGRKAVAAEAALQQSH